MSGLRSQLFIIILLAYLVAGILYATLTPNWQAPDEPAHYNYIRYLAAQASFPELVRSCYNQAYLEQLKSRHFPPELAIDPICYEFHQPPLYYLLAAPLFKVTGGSLLALRLLSVALGSGVVGLAFSLGRAIFPDQLSIAYGTMAFVAFVPMHGAMLASVNNDVLAELILAALLLLLTRRLLFSPPPSNRSDILLGILLGLGLVTKMTIYIAVPLIAITLWVGQKSSSAINLGTKEQPFGTPIGWAVISQNRGKMQGRIRVEGWNKVAKQATIIYGLALLIALPWYVRNIILYDNFDLLGLIRHDEVVVGQLRTVDFIAEVGWLAYLRNFITTTFHSFWGQFGWMAVPMDSRVYLILTLLTLIALGGLFGFWTSYPVGISDFGFWKGSSSPSHPPTLPSSHSSTPSHSPTLPSFHGLTRGQRRALALMAVTIGLMILAYSWYNLTFVQFQGRYLFPALIPLGLFFSLGLSHALQQHWAWWLVGGLMLALGWVSGASLGNGHLDKWAVLITGLFLGLAAGRALLIGQWPLPARWLMAACYSGLALLSLLSPFWFVQPFLSP